MTKALSQDQKHALVQLLAGRLARTRRDVTMESLRRKGLVVSTSTFNELTTDGFVEVAKFPYAVGVYFERRGRQVWGVYKTLPAAKKAYADLAALHRPTWLMLGSALAVSQALRELT